MKTGRSGKNPEADTNPAASFEILVSDENSDPVPNAQVSVEETAYEAGGSTSSTGRCSIELPAAERSVKVMVEHPTYTTVQDELAVNDSAVVDVTLTERDMADEETTRGQQSDNQNATPQSPDDTEPSREALLKELIELDKKRSRQVTRGRMRTDGKYEPEAYEKEFGSWSAALQSVSFPDEESDEDNSSSSSTQEAYSKTEVLDAIAEVVQKLDHEPRISDMNQHGRMSPGPAYRYFDSWSDAVAATKQEGIEEPTASSKEDVSANSVESTEKSSIDDPLENGLEKAPRGRLSDVIVDVLGVIDGKGTRRTAEVDIRTAADEDVVLNVWEKHDIDWSFEPGDRLQFNEVRLKRWDNDGTPAHHLSTTRDFSVTRIEEGSQSRARSDDIGGSDEKKGLSPVKRLTGLGGATEADAKVLVDEGYETRADLESASLDELRALPDLDDGIALRIKAELG